MASAVHWLVSLLIMVGAGAIPSLDVAPPVGAARVAVLALDGRASPVPRSVGARDPDAADDGTCRADAAAMASIQGEAAAPAGCERAVHPTGSGLAVFALLAFLRRPPGAPHTRSLLSLITRRRTRRSWVGSARPLRVRPR